MTLAKFAVNSSVCTSTGFSPFEAVCERRAPFPGDLAGQRSDVPRAEAAATRILALTTACRDHFETSQLNNQARAKRRAELPLEVGDLVLLSTANLVDSRKKTAFSRLSSRFVGPFRVMETTVDESAPKQGRTGNYVWLGLPASLGQIRQPFNLARLRRFVTTRGVGGLCPYQGTTALDPIVGQACEG